MEALKEPTTGPLYAESAVGIMRTRSGRAFDLVNPRIADVDIHDIATALSHICRFTGQSACHYSVAEHSVRVMAYVEGKYPHAPATLLRMALLHDAHEAYINDVTRPQKEAMRRLCAPHPSPYDVMEERVQRAVYAAFSMPFHASSWREIVKEADNAIYCREAEVYMAPPADRAPFAQAPEVAAWYFMRAFESCSRWVGDAYAA